jgi:hypothetical protein
MRLPRTALLLIVALACGCKNAETIGVDLTFGSGLSDAEIAQIEQFIFIAIPQGVGGPGVVFPEGCLNETSAGQFCLKKSLCGFHGTGPNFSLELRFGFDLGSGESVEFPDGGDVTLRVCAADGTNETLVAAGQTTFENTGGSDPAPIELSNDLTPCAQLPGVCP